MNKKIVFFDIDGTLFDPVIGVPDSTKKSIHELIDKGHIPVICTGRTRAMIPEYLVDIGFPGIVAGAGTYIEYKDKVVHHKLEEIDNVRDMLDLFIQNNIKYIIEGPECVYYDSNDQSEEYNSIKKVLKTVGKGKVEPIMNQAIKMNKITCSLSSQSHFENVLSKIEEKFDMIKHQGLNFIELVPRGYNKATGIEKLINYLSIDRKDTYAFGDSTNDLEMLDFVEYGIAMGNSYEEVLERAKYKTKSIDEDGIYFGLKEFGLI